MDVKLSPGYDKVIAVAHPAHGLHDFTLVVFNDLDALQALHQHIGRQIIQASGINHGG